MVNINVFFLKINPCVSACNCNPEGSESQQCDSDGQCDCKGTVQGKHCDICPSNMFDISEGCLS